MKHLVLLLLLFSAAPVMAQINVGSHVVAKMNKPGKLSDDDIEDFKKTTTLFTLQYKDYQNQQDFEKAIGEVWKITKFKVIRPEEIDSYAVIPGYSIFSFGAVTVSTSRAPGVNTLSSLHIYYGLWIPELNKKGEFKSQDYYANASIFSNPATYFEASKTYGNGYHHKAFSENLLNFIYNDAVLYNWGAGYIRGYLKTINDLLIQGETQGTFSSVSDDDIMKKLRRDTLYVPDYVNTHHSMFTGQESEDDDFNVKDVKSYYPHPIKYVSSETINDIILHATKPIYYLVYVRSGTDKFVSVYSSQKGLIYSRYKAVSYNFKNKDLSSVANAEE